MIASVARAIPSRTPVVAVSELVKTAARSMAMMPIYPRLRARIRARCTTVRRRGADHRRVLGSPPHPPHTTMEGGGGIHLAGRGGGSPEDGLAPQLSPA